MTIFIVGIGSFIAIHHYEDRLMNQTVGGVYSSYIEGTVSSMGNNYINVDSSRIYSAERSSDTSKEIYISLKSASRDVYRVGSKVRVGTIEDPFNRRSNSRYECYCFRILIKREMLILQHFSLCIWKHIC